MFSVNVVKYFRRRIWMNICKRLLLYRGCCWNMILQNFREFRRKLSTVKPVLLWKFRLQLYWKSELRGFFLGNFPKLSKQLVWKTPECKKEVIARPKNTISLWITWYKVLFFSFVQDVVAKRPLPVFPL